MAEASSNLARYDGVKYGFRDQGEPDFDGDGSKDPLPGIRAGSSRRIMLGTYVLSAGYYDAYYRKASQVRTLIRRDFEQAFQNCDLILTPGGPHPGLPALGKKPPILCRCT